MKHSKASFWVYTFCFLSFVAFGWNGLKTFPQENIETIDLASKGAFESAQQCGPERSYLLKDLAKISSVYTLTRTTSQVGVNSPPKECVSFIMQNFLPLNTRTNKMAECRVPIATPSKGADDAGFPVPCVTEPYVNSVYNALLDVGDCLNIPVKELLPKLYNESGLHVNTLGGGFDAGVGQLTVSALKAVFMRYDDRVEQPSTLDWFMREISKSSKASCKRIVAEESAYKLEVPKDKRLCIVKEANAADCYTPWSSVNRCVVMAVPTNPLRNVLFTGIFYRTMLKNATGLGYGAGSDILNTRFYKEGEPLNGYIGKGRFVERMRNLGATGANDAVVRQIIVSLGFNAGIDSGRIFLENYLKQREAKKLYLKNEDVDFQNVSTGKWAIVTNLPTFLRGLMSEDAAEFEKALASFEVLRDLRIDANIAQKSYKELRGPVQRELAAIKKIQSAAERDKKTNELKVKYDKYRHPILQAVFAKADQLTLPEFMRIAHAHSIVTVPGAGGAPGYLSFIASMHTKLEKEMGARVCTADQYLQF
ncbi:hypothetical protein ACES2L_11170 [Bdellovibrio bacteriovorus]